MHIIYSLNFAYLCKTLGYDITLTLMYSSILGWALVESEDFTRIWIHNNICTK